MDIAVYTAARMSLLFIGLSIPVLIFILIYNYNKNSAGIVSILDEAVAQTSQAGVERAQDLIDNTESSLRFLAEVAASDVVRQAYLGSQRL